MNELCKARTKSGQPCKGAAGKNGLCLLHAYPERAAELGRKSGQARRNCVLSDEPLLVLQPPRTALEVRDVLGQVMAELRARHVDPRVASTLAYVASVLLKSIEVGDVEDRLAGLEAMLKNRHAKD